MMNALTAFAVFTFLIGSSQALSYYDDPGQRLWSGRQLHEDPEPDARVNFKSNCGVKCSQYGTCNEDIARCAGGELVQQLLADRVSRRYSAYMLL